MAALPPVPAAREIAPGLLSYEADEESTGFATAPKNARPIVLLPGFGNSMADYEAPFGDPSEGIAPQLRERGWRVHVLPLERKAWLNVARSLLTLGVWRGTLTTDPGYSWYVKSVADTVRRAQDDAGAETVHLLGHSAGGWLGRAFLGRARGSGLEAEAAEAAAAGSRLGPHPAVASLTTLGTPHRPPPKPVGGAAGGASGGARDMTGGALGWVESSWPGAAYGDAGVRYVAVAGRSVRGCAAAARGRTRTLHSYAHDAYKQVAGEGDGVWGDCVVPTASAVLEGATNVVLDGVRHSMARIGSFDERAADDHVWYGSAQVLDSWLLHVAALDTPDQAAGTGAAALAGVREASVVLPGGSGEAGGAAV
ncbi:MAG: Alpha/Beta hydrolase protein [Monoraphidium minutum]|nr:MAG: Alpha/Beta hydrolase protein [Monoraphidium minutum]